MKKTGYIWNPRGIIYFIVFLAVIAVGSTAAYFGFEIMDAWSDRRPIPHRATAAAFAVAFAVLLCLYRHLCKRWNIRG